MIVVPGIHVPAACKHTHVNAHEDTHEIYKQLQTGVREKEKVETKGESVTKSRR